MLKAKLTNGTKNATIICMRKGFTLIELMIVVVIIGILTAIAIPNFYKLVDRAKSASVVANMHTTQVTVETRAIDNNQTYFPNIASFMDDLPTFKNPFNDANPCIQNSSAANIEGVVEYEGESGYYTITGFGKDISTPLLLLNPSTHTF